MTSSNNLATIEPWMFRPSITDSWYPESFARETESALTKALQQSFFTNDYCSTTTASGSTGAGNRNTTLSVSVSGSGSEPETPGSKLREFNTFKTFNTCNTSNTALGVKPTKRKSRASKRSMTTFIQADPANFRQMVQQVTGVKLEGNGQLPVSSVVKPEPMRRQPFVNKLQGLLPTLDTSAYLLKHQENSTAQRVVPVSGSMTTVFDQFPAVNQMTEDGVDFYSFSSFPTLESSF